MHNAEFNDLRLAQLYETLCPWGRSDQFFLDLANECPNSRILDLGCGTGQITVALSEAGHRVMGIDPAAASLTLARAKPGAEQVVWREGTSADAPAQAFDLVLMTNHVAQFITDEEAWLELLTDVHRALVPGGRLVFDSRDPVAREWEHWTRLKTYQQTPLPDGRHLETWTELTDVSGDLATFVHHYAFSDTEEPLLSRSTLCFRPEETLRASLQTAGFEIEGMYGGWRYEAVGQGDGEFIVVARAKK